MTDVFISYRRADAGDIAGRIADRLKELPQVNSVFLDVESIGYGDNFVDKINHVISRSEYCLLLIGPKWAGPNEDGSLRIMEDGDFVRMEAAAAVNSDVKVIPIFLHGAEMPTSDQLPADLQPLTLRNGYPVRTAFFGQDIEGLFDNMFGADRVKPGTPLATRLARRGVKGLIWAAVAGFLLILFAFGLNLTTGKSLNALFDYSASATWGTIMGIPLIGFLFGFFRRGMKI